MILASCKTGFSCFRAAAALVTTNLIFATAASAQLSRNRTWCNDSSSAVDQTITGCTALIRSGRESKHNLAIDFNNRGVAYYNKTDYDRAIADYNQAIRLDPSFVQAYNGRCATYNNKGDSDRALADCNEAISLDPNFAFAYYNRGIVKRARGDTAGGDTDIARARELDPKLGE